MARDGKIEAHVRVHVCPFMQSYIHVCISAERLIGQRVMSVAHPQNCNASRHLHGLHLTYIFSRREGGRNKGGKSSDHRVSPTPRKTQREPRRALQIFVVISDSERALKSVRWEDRRARVCKCVHAVNQSYTFMYARCADARTHMCTHVSAAGRSPGSASCEAGGWEEEWGGRTVTTVFPLPTKDSERAAKSCPDVWSYLRLGTCT